MKVDILKIIFTIIIGLTVVSILIGSYDAIFWYLIMQWVWLTITNSHLIRFDHSPKFGKTLNKINVISFSVIFIIDLLLLLLFAASFGTIFPGSYLETIFVITAFLFFISTTILIYTASKNILLLNPKANYIKVVFELIMFPVGLWTITKSYLNIHDQTNYSDT